MSYKPQRTFNGTQGNPSTDTMGPEQLSHDIDELCKMFNPNAIHDGGAEGGIGADNLNFDVNDIGGVSSSDIKALRRDSTDGTLQYSTDGTTFTDAVDTSPFMEKGVDYVTAGKASGTTLGNKATAEGYNTIASGDNSHAEGAFSEAKGLNAHAEGDESIASGTFSHAEGSESIASGGTSHAEGGNTTASGQYSHAEGVSTVASGQHSHAEGLQATASGTTAHAEGSRTTASGQNSHAEGLMTTSNHRSQHVFGEFNVVDGNVAGATARGDYVEIVGNGTAANVRSNARTLDWSGNETLAGKLTVGTAPSNDMDVATKQYVDTSVSGTLPSQSGQSGKYLTTNGTNVSWGTVDALPSQSGQSGKYLKTNGTTASWATVDNALPSQSGQSGKYLATDGTTASWRNAPSEVFTVTVEKESTPPRNIVSDKTFEDIVSANTSGKLIIVKYSASATWTVYYDLVSLTGGLATFEYFATNNTVNYLTCSSTDVWTESAVTFQNKIFASGILKGDGNGGVSAAVAGTDYQAVGDYMVNGVDYVTAGKKANTTLGTHATAEGYITTASGYGSHAEGNETTASGNYSHAEGDATFATSYASHTEGLLTEASGYYSHAEGWDTTANHRSQHVFGEFNVLDQSSAESHERGTYVEIVGNGGAALSRSNARTLDWSGNETLAGKLTVGSAPTNNMDVATKQYVDTSVSNVSLPSQSGNSGKFLTTDGTDASWADIPSNSFVATYGSTTYSVLYAAYTAGKTLYVQHDSGLYPLLKYEQQTGANVFDFTGVNAATNSLRIRLTNIPGITDTQWSITTTPIIPTQSGHGGQFLTTDGATPSWTNTPMVKGVDYVTAGQKANTTLGTMATAEGRDTEASGDYAHAEGANTIASQYSAHAEGYDTTASGSQSHAQNAGTTASGTFASSAGAYTTANHKSQFVFGEYNVLDTNAAASTARGDYVEIVGNGTGTSARSNARTLDWSGNETLAGKLTIGTAPTNNMDVVNKQYMESQGYLTLATLPIYNGSVV